MVAGSARPNLKMGAPDPENPLFLGFSVLRGGLRPWSREGPDHGVGVDPETPSDKLAKNVFLCPTFYDAPSLRRYIWKM